MVANHIAKLVKPFENIKLLVNTTIAVSKYLLVVTLIILSYSDSIGKMLFKAAK